MLKAGIDPIITALELSSCAQDPDRSECRHPATGETLPSVKFMEDLDRHIDNHVPRPVTGVSRHNVSQVQATATKVFGPALGADALVFVTEAAMMQVHDMADEPLESPARTRRLFDDEEAAAKADADADADASSWGYRVAARLDYSNAIGAVNLHPYVQWGHDVAGNSPAPSGPFVEGRTSLTLGVGADYLSRWEANASFTTYGGLANELYDRDFVSVSVKYSF